MKTDVLTSSVRDDWTTPRAFFDKLNAEFGFTLDAAASDENHLCERYYTKETDGLNRSWQGETVYCNPPYCRQTGKWIRKCYEESLKEGTTVVALVSAYGTGTQWFKDYIADKAEVRFLRGRLRFDEMKVNAPFNSMVIVWSPTAEKGKFSVIDK